MGGLAPQPAPARVTITAQIRIPLAARTLTLTMGGDAGAANGSPFFAGARVRGGVGGIPAVAAGQHAPRLVGLCLVRRELLAVRIARGGAGAGARGAALRVDRGLHVVGLAGVPLAPA